MSISDSQRQKASAPILVTLFPITIFSNDSQSKKAPSPILVTLLGRVMDVNEEQSQKALSPISVVPLGMMAYAILNFKFCYSIASCSFISLRLSSCRV